MKTVTDIKKLKSGYKVTFNESIMVDIELDIYFKYHLKPGETLDEKTYQQMIDENHKLYYTNLGVTRLKKMQTYHELKTYLDEKGCPKHILNEVMKLFVDRRYINDVEYVKTYIELKKYQEGPNLIASKFEQKGISKDIALTYISKINQSEILNDLIPKKLNSFKHKTKKQALQSTKVYFMSKGYDREIIEPIIFKHAHQYQGDDQALLSKTFDKLYNTYKDKKQGYELKTLLKQKLYQKGFSFEDIENIFIDKDVLS
jgi:SOS response regulatory protein OraA/RecX